MNPIGSVASAYNAQPTGAVQPAIQARPTDLPDGLKPSTSTTDGFSNLLDNVVNSVDATAQQAETITNKVLLGDSSQLHQSVIAMQEASTALDLMVAVRNKLVESYQELMRMNV
ncbi:MAG TPA: flagellar hook-basal body complex protein FliE [Opitutaceae bacterium]|nr:flagellar hook-basal body complex protein FliE [Opitutaceae bacterium]